jgi:hypothetical protein
MRSILGSHSDVAIFPYDLKLWTRYLDTFTGIDLARPENQNHVIQALLSDEKVVIATDVPSLVSVRQVLDQNSSAPETLAEIFDAFLHAYANNRGRQSWGLKTPWNEFYAREILNSFQDAVFIHVIRDPRKSALSAIYADGGSWFYDPGLHIQRWKKSAELAQVHSEEFDSRYFVIRYEDLAATPKETVQKLVASMGLPYEENMELGLGQPGWDGSNSSFTEVPSPKGSTRRPALPFDLEILYSRKLASQMSYFSYPVGDTPWLLAVVGSVSLFARLVLVWTVHRVIALKRVSRGMVKR